jgi:hypothetical protein
MVASPRSLLVSPRSWTVLGQGLLSPRARRISSLEMSLSSQKLGLSLFANARAPLHHLQSKTADLPRQSLPSLNPPSQRQSPSNLCAQAPLFSPAPCVVAAQDGVPLIKMPLFSHKTYCQPFTAPTRTLLIPMPSQVRAQMTLSCKPRQKVRRGREKVDSYTLY